MNDILKVEHLNKSYKDFSLKDISFSIPEGCITGFIGTNGAGKTTTLRTILGLAKKDSGNVNIFGLDMDKNGKQIKDRIGVVLDGGCFYEELSLNEMKNIISSSYSRWSEQDFRHYMDMFALDPKQKIGTLSKGTKMKYALALALSHNAELLIMDEPTSGLDPLIRSQLLAVLTSYMENGGKGVFFSTHITSDLDKIADMIIMIEKGRIIFQEDKDLLLLQLLLLYFFQKTLFYFLHLDHYLIVKAKIRKMLLLLQMVIKVPKLLSILIVIFLQK